MLRFVCEDLAVDLDDLEEEVVWDEAEDLREAALIVDGLGYGAYFWLREAGSRRIGGILCGDRDGGLGVIVVVPW